MIFFYDKDGAAGAKSAFDGYGFAGIDAYYAASKPLPVQSLSSPRMVFVNLKTGVTQKMITASSNLKDTNKDISAIIALAEAAGK